MNEAVMLKNRCFYIHGKPIFVNSGEIHYFRVPAKRWEDCIRKAKEAGLNTVSSYIPWRWHEPEKGKFYFSRPCAFAEQDLIRFIQIIKKHKLYFFPRIGPVSNAELTREGLPDWLVEGYDHVRVKKQDGENLPHPGLPSLLEPTFQKFVTSWYDAVLEILKPFLIDQGGNVFVIQLCNEIGMVNWCARTADYNPHTTSCYRQFLAKKFNNDISLLNREYNTQYSGFDQLRQPEGVFDPARPQLFWDWSEFYRDFYASYYQSLHDRVRNHDIALPLTANIPQFWDYNMSGRGDQGVMTSTQYKYFERKAPRVILGGAYQMRRLDFENFHDTIILTEVARMMTHNDAPISCAEMQVGGMNDRPRIYSSDVELNLRSTVGHGVNSVNDYMFASGINRHGLGCRSTYHEWQAPVSSDGTKRPHYQAVKEFGQVMKFWGSSIAESGTVHDISVGFYPLYYETEYIRGDAIDYTAKVRDRFFFDGLLRLLQTAGYNFSLKNMADPETKLRASDSPLWVFSLDYMDEIVQEKLLNFVNDGGTLILYPTLPTQNAKFQPCTILADGLGLAFKKKVYATIVMHGRQDIFLDAFYPVTVVETKDSHKVLSEIPGEGTSALEKKVKQGKIVYMGYGLTHFFDYHIEHVDKITRMAGGKKSVETGGYDVHAVLRMKGENGFLFLCNFNDADKSINLKIQSPRSLPSGRTRTITVPRRSGWILPIRQNIDDDFAVGFSSAEILKISRKSKKHIALELRAPRDYDFYMTLESKRIKGVLIFGKKPDHIAIGKTKTELVHKAFNKDGRISMQVILT